MKTPCMMFWLMDQRGLSQELALTPRHMGVWDCRLGQPQAPPLRFWTMQSRAELFSVSLNS